MAQSLPNPDHVWLVMIKAMRALTRYGVAAIEDTGLGESDFRVLEALLHKGPLPVNTIGPIVDLTPGSISVAVDRLVEKGLVSRVESTEDRRVRIVALSDGEECFRIGHGRLCSLNSRANIASPMRGRIRRNCEFYDARKAPGVVPKRLAKARSNAVRLS